MQTRFSSGSTLTLVTALALAVAVVCVRAETAGRPESPEALAAEWQKTSPHPLMGKVFDARSAPDKPVLIELADLLRIIEAGRGQIVLLGEQHDNTEHHRFQAMITAKRAEPTAAVFEQFDARQQPGLEAFAAARAKDAGNANLDLLKRETDWAKSGWSKYNYDALLTAVIDAGLPIYAGDVPRDMIRKVAKEGESALAADERTRLGLDEALGDKFDAASAAEIEESHCGMMPKTALGGMALAQRYRDAQLADVAMKAAAKHGSALVFAGSGHVRTDRGMPWYLSRRAPDKTVVSVMMIEVENGKAEATDYLARDPDGKPAADFLVFTPKAERDDPCEQFRSGKKP